MEDPSFVIIIIYLVCLVNVWERREKDNAFSLYNLYGHALEQEPLPQGS